MTTTAQWKNHTGTECPVPRDTVVDIKTDYGTHTEAAYKINWGEGCNIKQWRVHEAFKGAPDDCSMMIASESGRIAFANQFKDGCYHSSESMHCGRWKVIATRDDASSELEMAQSVTAASTVKAALKHMQDRAATYDNPQGERSMSATVCAFNAITGLELSEEEGWLFMILLKATRSQQGNFKLDNYEDGAAYFGLMAEAGANERD